MDAYSSLDKRDICGGRKKLKKSDIVELKDSWQKVYDIYYDGINTIIKCFGEETA